jgi:TubC N-terminal docking domain
MTPVELVTTLRCDDVILTACGDRLRVDAPEGVLSDELRQAIRQHKAALLAMLTPERRIPLPRSPAPCWRCTGPSERQGLRYLLCPQCQAETGAHDALTSG